MVKGCKLPTGNGGAVMGDAMDPSCEFPVFARYPIQDEQRARGPRLCFDVVGPGPFARLDAALLAMRT
jgi:hypothetical protein